MNKPTPGPWRLEGGAVADQVYVVGVNGEQVASISPTVGQEKRGNYETYKKNALIIAAAPGLLEALKTWKEFWDTMPKGQMGNLSFNVGLFNEGFIKMERAIAKAEGK